MKQVARILPVGLEQQERTILGVVVNLLSAFDLDVEVVDDASEAPHIALVNGEASVGMEYLHSPDTAPVKIVISATPLSGYGAHSLSKPVRVQALKDAIFELWTQNQESIQQVEKNLGSRSKAKPQPRPAKTEAGLRAEQVQDLMLALLLARSQQKHLLFSGQAGHGVLLDGLHGQYYSGLSGEAMEAVCQQQGQAQALGPGPFMSAIEGLEAKPFNDIAWSAARFGAAGRLYDGAELDHTLVMKAFPRFPRRHLRPEHTRVAAMLTKTPMSLRELEANSGIAMDVLIEFYNIGVVLDVLQAKPTEQREIRKLSGGKRGGLLAKIAKRLKIGGNT